MVQKFKKVAKILKNAHLILLVCHKNPDHDAIGSLLAMARYVASQRKKYYCFVPGGASLRFNFMPGFKKVRSRLPQKNFDVIAGLDYGDFSRLGLDEALTREQYNPVIIAFDHHSFGKKQADVAIVSATASSTCEIIYNFFRAVGFKINKETAILLLTGIVSDTQSLKLNTTSEVLRIVANLLEHGADIFSITSKLLRLKSLRSLKLKAKIFQRAVFYPHVGLIAALLRRKDYKHILNDPGEIALLIEELAALPEARVALFLEEEKDKIWYVHLRSRQNVNVGLVASKLGGGGHAASAGFTATEKPHTIIKKVLTLLKIHHDVKRKN